MPYDWLYFDLVKNVSKEKTFHACQIPQKLAEVLVKSCTMPNDIVLVVFGGSGSELEVCKMNNRQYIAAGIDEKYHKMITYRLNNGGIRENYRLDLRRYEKKNSEAQLLLIQESEKDYQMK